MDCGVTQLTYDPENWLVSLTRTLKDYVSQGLDKSVLDQSGNPVGLGAYEVVMEFPGPTIDDVKNVPLAKTLVHFEVDDPETRLLGFGDNVFTTNYNETTGTIQPQEAREHRVNFDVGIWATDSTGGTTARMKAYQILTNLFSGSRAVNALREFSDGGDGPIDVLSFLGGRFATERVNDIDVYRTIGATLVVRVYSRTAQPSVPEPAITEVFVDELTIPVDSP